ncbi:MAG: sulfurtransferase TusA family protein [Nitrospirae bacterium]|nr:sulfurtransferase TusA family protein [Nitrospirota bacterium]
MTDSVADVAADQQLDIRGVTCPITFVKSKLKLETMASGQVLRILIDYRPSAVNVPRSLANEGHAILSLTEEPGPVWTLVVRKG